jgi:hypothetical protein
MKVATHTVWKGDCREVLARWPADCVDSIVTDPPYGLEFMGKEWDRGVPDVAFWREFLRVAKPGAHLVAFGGTRTWHRLACAIEDAGWEIRDTLAWMHGQGFPKSLDVSKAIDAAGAADGEALRAFRAALIAAREAKGMTRAQVSEAVVGSASGAVWNWETGLRVPTGEHWNKIVEVLGLPSELTGLRDAAEREVLATRRGSTKTYDVGAEEEIGPRPPVTAPATDAAKQWNGWGTALKPAFEPIILARKPLIGTVAANVLAHGVGGLNIDGCRIALASGEENPSIARYGSTQQQGNNGWGHVNRGARFDADAAVSAALGRWPANVVLDEEAAAILDAQTGTLTSGVPGRRRKPHETTSMAGTVGMLDRDELGYADSGGASRFFYVAKASRSERTHGGAVVNGHATVKPLALMRWLVRLVTPPGGFVLDPFVGSGTTLVAAKLEGFGATGIEQDAESARTALARVDATESGIGSDDRED